MEQNLGMALMFVYFFEKVRNRFVTCLTLKIFSRLELEIIILKPSWKSRAEMESKIQKMFA
jgi:hypothetical protein